METSLKVFEYGEKQVRTVEKDGEIWFVAKDVALTLEYSDTSNSSRLFQSVPDIWKGTKRICTPGGKQEMLCLTEQGLYFFLGRSDKKAALPYQIWVADKVVPSIRKHGMYISDKLRETAQVDPEMFEVVMNKYLAEKEKTRARAASFNPRQFDAS